MRLTSAKKARDAIKKSLDELGDSYLRKVIAYREWIEAEEMEYMEKAIQGMISRQLYEKDVTLPRYFVADSNAVFSNEVMNDRNAYVQAWLDTLAEAGYRATISSQISTSLYLGQYRISPIITIKIPEK